MDISPKLLIKDLIIESDNSVIQFFGKNGSGKSTVLELIRQELSTKKKNFACLNQDYRSNWLWWRTARQNLELSYGRINSTGSFTNSDIYKRHSAWLEPLLRETNKSVFFERQNEMSTVDLSGGQLQRVIVFRELLHSPDYFLLDEAFSALDTDITSDIIAMLKHEQTLRPFVIISVAHSDQVRNLLGGDIFQFHVDPKSKLLSLTKNEKN